MKQKTLVEDLAAQFLSVAVKKPASFSDAMLAAILPERRRPTVRADRRMFRRAYPQWEAKRQGAYVYIRDAHGNVVDIHDPNPATIYEEDVPGTELFNIAWGSVRPAMRPTRRAPRRARRRSRRARRTTALARDGDGPPPPPARDALAVREVAS